MGRMVTPRSRLNPTPRIGRDRGRRPPNEVLGLLMLLMGAGVLVWAGCFWVAYALFG